MDIPPVQDLDPLAARVNLAKSYSRRFLEILRSMVVMPNLRLVDLHPTTTAQKRSKRLSQ